MIPRLLGIDYDGPALSLAGGSLMCMAGCPVRDLASSRRDLRDRLKTDAGVLAAGDPKIFAYVGLAQIRNLWARLRGPLEQMNAAQAKNLDAIVFGWLDKIAPDYDGRVALLVGTIPVTGKPSRAEDRLWTFVYPDGHAERVDLTQPPTTAEPETTTP